MNLTSFGGFLVDKLVIAAKVFEQNLLKANFNSQDAFQNAIQTSRASATHETLTSIASQIPALINEFYNNPSPASHSSDSVAPNLPNNADSPSSLITTQVNN